jgi:plastocyanin
MLAAASLAALAASATAGAATPTLTGSVTSAAKITLTQGGKPLKTLKAGTYTIVVKDTTGQHNFHLTGPGVNKTTSVAATQTVTWKVKLAKGKYTFVCDPHKSFMKGSFTVS